jgi:hypothetical protein
MVLIFSVTVASYTDMGQKITGDKISSPKSTLIGFNLTAILF